MDGHVGLDALQVGVAIKPFSKEVFGVWPLSHIVFVDFALLFSNTKAKSELLAADKHKKILVFFFKIHGEQTYSVYGIHYESHLFLHVEFEDA